MPGATPAGSPGGTGVSHCQQQAPVVGRFVFPLSLVLGLSPRTRLSCSYRISWCFLGLDQARLHPTHVRDDHYRHTLPLHMQELRVTSLKAEGKEGSRWHHSRASSHAWLLAAQHPVRDRHFFFWVLALTNKSLGPAAVRHQSARPVPESRICAFATLFTATFYAPPLCTVNVEFSFTYEPSPGPFLMPFSS